MRIFTVIAGIDIFPSGKEQSVAQINQLFCLFQIIADRYDKWNRSGIFHSAYVGGVYILPGYVSKSSFITAHCVCKYSNNWISHDIPPVCKGEPLP